MAQRVPFWDNELKDFYNIFWIPDINKKNQDTTFITKLLEEDKNTTADYKYCRKIRIYPNDIQTLVFNKCIGTSRYFYNKTVAYLNENGIKGNLYRSILRPKIMKNDRDILEDDLEYWQSEVPYDTRQEAINDAITAFKSACTNIRNKNITHFEIKYRSKKKSCRESFRVEKRALNIEEMTIMPQAMKKQHKNIKSNKTFKNKLRMRKRDVAKFKEDGTLDGNFMIVKEKPGKWYICLPRTKQNCVSSNPSYQSVFHDPGVRTFQTWYSPEGDCGKINVPKKLYKLAERHDGLQSVLSKCVKPKTKGHIKRRMALLRHSMKNIVNDLHWQTCSFLCNNFKVIVQPSFEVSKMVIGSPLGSTITRKMLTLSHGLFRERLIYYGACRGNTIKIVEEDYTTRTCGSCGALKEMNGLKVYDCSHCCLHIDRDCNGARNICLKTITPIIKSILS